MLPGEYHKTSDAYQWFAFTNEDDSGDDKDEPGDARDLTDETLSSLKQRVVG